MAPRHTNTQTSGCLLEHKQGVHLNVSSEDQAVPPLLSAEILLAVGVPSDLHGPRHPPPALGVHAPAEPRLSVEGRLALRGRDAGSEQPAQQGDAERRPPGTAGPAGTTHRP